MQLCRNLSASGTSPDLLLSWGWTSLEEFEGLWHLRSLSLLQTKWVKPKYRASAGCLVRAFLAQEQARGWSWPSPGHAALGVRLGGWDTPPVLCSQALPPSVPASSLGHLPPPGTLSAASLYPPLFLPTSFRPSWGRGGTQNHTNRRGPWLLGPRPKPQPGPLDSSPGLHEELNAYISV